MNFFQRENLKEFPSPYYNVNMFAVLAVKNNTILRDAGTNFHSMFAKLSPAFFKTHPKQHLL